MKPYFRSNFWDFGLTSSLTLSLHPSPIHLLRGLEFASAQRRQNSPNETAGSEGGKPKIAHWPGATHGIDVPPPPSCQWDPLGSHWYEAETLPPRKCPQNGQRGTLTCYRGRTSIQMFSLNFSRNFCWISVISISLSNMMLLSNCVNQWM